MKILNFKNMKNEQFLLDFKTLKSFVEYEMTCSLKKQK